MTLADAAKRHTVKRRQNLVWRFISGVRYSRKNVKCGFGVRFWEVLSPRWSGSPEGCDSMSKGRIFARTPSPGGGFFRRRGDVIRWYEKKARHVGTCRDENKNCYICLFERSEIPLRSAIPRVRNGFGGRSIARLYRRNTLRLDMLQKHCGAPRA